ncbi:EAL domain-containing protein [Pseudoalteromonas shioyasakiensis]|uniref:EAL domain-containing protein n=1 Tax=Pseudoalteromonas shioyasakiensis TaxID=1190813 RepID=UPI00211824B2|nr:EAL domain-containing protein [Pseudoalteromonas shioyasakiensis]MCQ8879168.1 EAL domain-containing protein [Pseudoalteromonas shioyasakiensis]
MTAKVKNVHMHMLSAYIGVCLLVLGVFNLLLSEVLHKKVHVIGTEIAQQVYELNLNLIADKEVIAALAKARGFMLEPHSLPAHFPAFTHLESEIFNYQTVSLQLYHWPSWVVESYLFILLNLVVIGAAVWGYRWWALLIKRYEKEAFKAPEKLATYHSLLAPSPQQKADSNNKAITHKPIKQDAMTKLYCLHQNNHCFFALFYWSYPFPESIDLESHFKLVITKGFTELPGVSIRLLISGGVAITLQGVPQTQLDKYTHKLHQIIYQASLVYRGDLSRKDIKIGICNYRTGADQAIVYQLTKSALEQAKQSPWQHVHRAPFNHTYAEVLKNTEEELPEYISKKKFILFFQPLFELDSGEILQHEALIRIRHKSLGLLSAKQFIPHLKTNNQLMQLDIAVIEHVIALLKSEPSSLIVSINLHAFNWFNASFWQWFEEKVGGFKAADKLQFEISAEDFYAQQDKLAPAIKQIKAVHGSVLVDNVLNVDKLAFLSEFKLVKGIKLGYEVIHGIDKSLKQQKIVRHIIMKSNHLNLPVYGVGVETQQELQVLQKLGVTAAQGFYFTEPLQEFTQVTS